MADHDSLAALYARARTQGAVFDLSDRAKWRLSGPDRVRYLNGQVTNDIRRIHAGEALTACITSAKGRLCGVVFVSAASDYLRIDAEPALREPLGARLGRYIIADDVTLADTTEGECLFHVFAAAAPGPFPGAEIRIASRFARPGFDILAPREEHARLLAALGASHVAVPPAIAECLRIEAGVPRWGAELTEETLPPEAGLDNTAIDYQKGCYIGQEVISRIKSVGHVNRQLAGFTSASPLSEGMILHSPENPEKPAGEITSAAWSFGLERWAALGYLKRGFAQTTLQATPPDGATVAVQFGVLPLVPSLAS